MKALVAHLTKGRRRVFFWIMTPFLLWLNFTDSQTQLPVHATVLGSIAGLALAWLILVWIIDPLFNFTDRMMKKFRVRLEERILGTK